MFADNDILVGATAAVEGQKIGGEKAIVRRKVGRRYIKN